MTSDQGVQAPGWDAITNVFASLYPGVEPRHIGYIPGLALGSGLQGCSAYQAADHWHYVTYGLTELWEKDADSEPSVSGWGYEFTMRVPLHDGEHDYRELKDGLGLDHFEGRSYTGFHRHATRATAAQAFCTLLRRDPKAPAPA